MGLRVINSTGQPGSLPSIILRGGASINNPGSPLVVVDGIVRTLNDINSSDIESIQVLKDAASTAVYGARANNGVILITTNQGKVGVSQLTYKSKMGINTRRDTYNYLNAKDYIYYNRIALNNTNLSRAYGGVAAINPDNVAGYGFVNPHMFDIAKINDANRSEFGNRLNDGWQWMIDPWPDKTDTYFLGKFALVSDSGCS